MQLSIIKNNFIARTVKTRNFQGVAKIALSQDYSLSTFKNSHRTNENFESTETIGLDFDNGLSLEDAIETFKEYNHLILTTRHHRKDKKGITCDRFRVILELTRPITDQPTYRATINKLHDKYTAVDESCKDPARMFYPSIALVSKRTDGLKIEPVLPPATQAAPLPVESPTGMKGDLNQRTLKFLLLGAPDGSKHIELYQAARDCHQNGYSQPWVLDKLDTLANHTGQGAYVDDGAIKTVADAFNKPPEYEANIKPRAFNFRGVGELYEKTKPVEWIVENQLSKGGMSIFAGPPKSGKSTLVRQLVATICHGGTFLGDECVKGSVLYLALEEQDAMIKTDFQTLRITKDDPIQIHTGGALTENATEELHQTAIETRPTLIIVDTMLLLAQVKNISDYAELNIALAKLRKIARDSDAHVLLVHHTTKPSQFGGRGGMSILGSTAIFGAVDYALTLEQRGRERLIHTQGRGTRLYFNRMIIYNEDSKTYTLGSVLDGDM